MQRLHLTFIIGLILIGVSLLFFAKTLRGVLTMITPSHAVAAPKVIRPEQHSLFVRFFQQMKSTLKRNERENFVKTEEPPSVPLSTTPTKPHVQGPVFMYVLDEEPPQPVINPALTEQERTALTERLAKKRADHAQLTQEVFALFGPQAAQETLLVLTTSENTAYKDANTCKNFKQCLKNQETLNDKKQARLNHIFEKHKSSFNYKTKSGPSDWKSFYRRVNDFRRAAD